MTGDDHQIYTIPQLRRELTQRLPDPPPEPIPLNSPAVAAAYHDSDPETCPFAIQHVHHEGIVAIPPPEPVGLLEIPAMGKTTKVPWQ